MTDDDAKRKIAESMRAEPLVLSTRKLTSPGFIAPEIMMPDIGEWIRQDLMVRVANVLHGRPMTYALLAEPTKAVPQHACGWVEWMDADAIYGPEKTGFAICSGSADYGAANTYANVNYCPECGEKLTEAES